MARRSRGSDALTAAEIEAFVAAATAMHLACCRPFLRIEAPHYRVLSELNAQVCEAILAVTGDKPKWMQTPPARSSH